MKRFVYLLFFIFIATSVLAASVSGDNIVSLEGVNPGSYSIDFKGGLHKDFVFVFVVNSEKELKVRGDLAKYVKLDKKRIFGKEKVNVSLDLPENAGYFGVSNIWVLAGSVAGIIKVNVPYPDRYADLMLSIPNVNMGDEIVANLKVSNFGKEVLNISPSVSVYSGKDLISVFKLDKKTLGVHEKDSYKFILNDFNYSAGDYLVAIKSGEFETRGIFRVGEFKIKILNYTREVNEGIGKFNVEIESLWNNKMKGVYAEVRVVGKQGGDNATYSKIAGDFDSSIVSLGGWEKRNLTGYFDSSDFEGDVKLNVDVYYFPFGDDFIYSDGAAESKIISVYVKKFPSWIPWAGVVFILIFLFWWFWRASK